jgi:hypothetical protein
MKTLSDQFIQMGVSVTRDAPAAGKYPEGF